MGIKLSRNIAIRENCYKLQQVWYQTWVVRGVLALQCTWADFFHLWWSCEKVVQYWRSQLNELNKIVVEPLPFMPKVCLLNDLVYGGEREQNVLDTSIIKWKKEFIQICQVLNLNNYNNFAYLKFDTTLYVRSQILTLLEDNSF